ncbi:hypothetical protein ACIPSJ_49620 [Streptomyces sp. NPDC090088]|uniref:hypothetical protein n=1 Tax=Streptomyces sp. NPDC090088 TaxID=3365944 RepID=UPI003829E244
MGLDGAAAIDGQEGAAFRCPHVGQHVRYGRHRHPQRELQRSGQVGGRGFKDRFHEIPVLCGTVLEHFGGTQDRRCSVEGCAQADRIAHVGGKTSRRQAANTRSRTFVYTINPQFVLHVPDQLRGDPNLHSTYASQDEWAFFHRIPPQAITSVHIYTMAARAASQQLQPQSITFQHDRWVANPNARYNPVTDPDAHFNLNMSLHIPPRPTPGTGAATRWTGAAAATREPVAPGAGLREELGAARTRSSPGYRCLLAARPTA